MDSLPVVKKRRLAFDHASAREPTHGHKRPVETNPIVLTLDALNVIDHLLKRIQQLEKQVNALTKPPREECSYIS